MDPRTNEIIESEEIQKNFRGKFYSLHHGELVAAKYLLGQIERPVDDKTDIANYYLFDEISGNDVFIEELLIDDISNKTSSFIGFSKILLAQYYLKAKRFDNARSTLYEVESELADYKRLLPKTNIDIILRLVRLEMEITKKIYQGG